MKYELFFKGLGGKSILGKKKLTCAKPLDKERAAIYLSK